MRRFHYGARHEREGKRCGPTGKRCYKSHAHALNEAGKIMDKPDCNAYAFRAYHCDYCGKWHLTSQDRGSFKAGSRGMSTNIDVGEFPRLGPGGP